MKAVLLLSGGIDSTVLLADILKKGHDVTALSMFYGQVHSREIEAAHAVAKHYGVDWRQAELPEVLPDGCSSLLDGESIPETHATDIDSTYVPGRNLMMISTAVALADATGRTGVFIGANAEDAAGYPDCRPRFFEYMTQATYWGTSSGVAVHAPLLYMPKREVVNLGRELQAPLELTWSCYQGLASGPCGHCGACQSRDEAMA
jgi:7-cyano-7-deazaguanine synthase